MNITQEEFSKRIHEIIEDKIFFSNISNNPMEVVEILPEEIVPSKVLFDGLNLFDGIEGIEDDIQQMHSFTDVEFKNNSLMVIVRHAFEGCPCEEEVMRKSDF
jgi:hypothetical protein